MLLCKAGSQAHEVDSIDPLEAQLAKLNEDVVREVQSIQDAQSQLATQIEEQEQYFNEEDVLHSSDSERGWTKKDK
ncbi:hypothetical protein PsorP6_016171 [Peronosclerospora sorghi]|uniref:Uncharacterized protein n=1 Tax=Peronosclerospora sorghi TaxID=230839 RepID=A0ACC0VMQ3_9STRA|nr:hypothetical protein PsorP6_016171 [Peronosclerospora sorghi]